MIEATSMVTAEVVVEKARFVQVSGFRRAVERIESAVASNDETGVYVSVVEALGWLSILAKRASLTDPDVDALRYARHRGTHQSASVVYREPGDVWRWRPAASLPTSPKHPHQDLREKYEQRLAREPLLDAFRRVVGLL
jgi:hypothetical protein